MQPQYPCPIYALTGCSARNWRSASLTALAFGKSLARSGSIRTTLEPARNRLAYLPRTPERMSSAGYSGRRSSESSSLISSSLSGRHGTRRYDSDIITSVGVCHDQSLAGTRYPEGEIPDRRRWRHNHHRTLYSLLETTLRVSSRYAGPCPGPIQSACVHYPTPPQCPVTRRSG